MPPPPPQQPPSVPTHFTEPTTHYWQSFLPAPSSSHQPPYQFSYPASLPDGRTLLLPIRPLPVIGAGALDVTETSNTNKRIDTDANKNQDAKEEQHPQRALASLLVNHASFSVVKDLSIHLATYILRFLSHNSSHTAASAADIDRSFNDLSIIVIGIPTLGLTIAPLVARALGAARYVPLGYSRKFWYEDRMSVGVESVTSPGTAGVGDLASRGSRSAGAAKRAFLDPNLVPLIHGKAVVLIDDVVSSGRTLNAVWDFLEGEEVGCRVLAVGVAMMQGVAWRRLLGEERVERVVGVLESPLLRAVERGWVAE